MGDETAFEKMMFKFVEETRERVGKHEETMRLAIADVKGDFRRELNDASCRTTDSMERVEGQLAELATRMGDVQSRLFGPGNGGKPFHDRITELERDQLSIRKQIETAAATRRHWTSRFASAIIAILASAVTVLAERFIGKPGG